MTSLRACELLETIETFADADDPERCEWCGLGCDDVDRQCCEGYGQGCGEAESGVASLSGQRHLRLGRYGGSW